MHILIFKHIPDEPAGHAEQWAADRGHAVAYHYWDMEHVLPALPDADLLIIMGGMMGAYEEEAYPWLVTEKRLIREAIYGGKRVLGICLGAQLIASALGAEVYRNSHAEIGFHEVVPVPENGFPFTLLPEPACVFQWHSDTFDLPAGACLAATSGNVINQAFTYGNNTIAIQFHPEMDEAIIEGLLQRAWDKEPPSPWKQSPGTIRSRYSASADGKKLLYSLLDHLATQR